MSTLPNFTPQELDTIARLHDQIANNQPEGAAIILNPAIPLHSEVITSVLNAAGQNPNKYPYLHSQITPGQSAASEDLAIIDAGADKNGNATALVWHANNENVLYSGATTMVLDGNSNQLLAYGSDTDVHSGLMGNHTNAMSARPAGKSLKILGVNYKVTQDGAVSFAAVGGNKTIGSGLSITVSDPIINVPSHQQGDYVLIALGRDSVHIPNADADYFYTEIDNQQDPHLIIPFTGSCTIPYPIAAGTTSANIQVTTDIYVDYGLADSVVVNPDPTYTPASRIQSGITVNTSTNTISWSFAYDKKSFSQTSSLVFGSGPANDKKSYFQFQFTVPLAAGAPQPNYTFTVYSYDSAAASQPFSASTTGAQISRIQFWWHCLARGTKVTLADGSSMNIEDLSNNQRVLTGSHGASLGVEATTLGYHKGEAGNGGIRGIYKLSTSDGNELVTTGAHPIMTPLGPVMACYLKKGDNVLTNKGVSQVEHCDPIDYSDTFHNLKLGNAEDRSSMPQSPINTFYANGILVGDHLALHNHADRQRYDLDYILPRINAEMRTDYANAVLDRKK